MLSLVYKVKLFSMLAFAAAAIVTANVYALSDREQQIADRIAPAGEVCLEGEDCAGAAAAPAATTAAASGPRSGEEVYNAACFTCHGMGIAGAPKLGDIPAWEGRIAAGMDTMVSNAINGINAMPAMGTCMSCSEEEIKVAVEYMAEASQ